METIHKIYYRNAQDLSFIESDTVDLVVTSPPYPMIQMWDVMFSRFNPAITDCIDRGRGHIAFKKIHNELDKVWNEVFRVLKNGGIACINIGDATRRLNGQFQLFSNHSRILNHCAEIGFSLLPLILWKKQTNAPNKFTGSGMLPTNAYVTLEHEYILILRKGDHRIFKGKEEKQNRRESALFWQERNLWYSDIWDFKEVKQKIYNREKRERSGAFPAELSSRLINMFSVKGDTILDPFLGTGTTTQSAITLGRNSIGVELDNSLHNSIDSTINYTLSVSDYFFEERIKQQSLFIKNYLESGKKLKFFNKKYGLLVMTSHETDIRLNRLIKVEQVGDCEYKVVYFEEQ